MELCPACTVGATSAPPTSAHACVSECKQSPADSSPSYPRHAAPEHHTSAETTESSRRGMLNRRSRCDSSSKIFSNSLASICASNAWPHRGHAGRDGHFLRLEQVHAATSHPACAPGKTTFAPTIAAAYGSPHALTWNIGTTGKDDVARGQVQRIGQRSPSKCAARLSGASTERPSDCRSCPTCSTATRRCSRQAAAI